jgi:hypothetical protein
MAYGLAVVIYSLVAVGGLGFYVCLTVMSALAHGPGEPGVVDSLKTLATVLPSFALLCVPAYFAVSRWWVARTRAPAFLPVEFRAELRKGYVWGLIFAYFGHVVFFGSLAIGALTYLSHGEGVPFGLGLGWGVQMYAVAIICIEVSFRGWRAKAFPNYRIERPRER